MAVAWHHVANERTGGIVHATWRCGGCKRLAVTATRVVVNMTPPVMVSPCTFCNPSK